MRAAVNGEVKQIIEDVLALYVKELVIFLAGICGRLANSRKPTKPAVLVYVMIVTGWDIFIFIFSHYCGNS